LTLPKPPPLGKANWYVGEPRTKIATNEDTTYSDSVAIAYDIEREKLFVLYSDKMTLIWDMKNKQAPTIN